MNNISNPVRSSEPNITCQKCRHRHPASRTCEESKRLADENRKTWIAGSCPGCGKTQMRTTDEPDPECEGCAAPAKIEQLQTVLRAAREKLVLYRQAHSGEYIGGMEYNALIHRIDAVLT